MLTQEPPAAKTEATLDNLARVSGKAELVNGKIVRIRPAGANPGRAAGYILIHLVEHEQVCK